jgi:hypothetical protein
MKRAVTSLGDQRDTRPESGMLQPLERLRARRASDCHSRLVVEHVQRPGAAVLGVKRPDLHY